MGRFWSLLFLLVPILGVGSFVWAMNGWWPMQGHWLPENINPSGVVIDNLFYFIMYLTGAIFVVTSLALFWFMWKYDAARNTEPVQYMHGSHTLEVVWSVLPAAALLFIAIYQMNAWASQKMRRPQVNERDKPALAEVTGRQFEWRIRYAGDDQEVGTPDDLHIVNDLHVPVNEEVVLEIKSDDVLHSFFLPNLRVKQDVVPGMQQYVWFKGTREGTYDIVCAELCGWGHYKMRGRITVESQEKYNQWYRDRMNEQNQASFTPVEEGSDE